MDTFKVAISNYALDHKIPPGSPFWREFNGSFFNATLTAFDFGRMVYDGHPFTTWHRNNWRHSTNYELGQHLALDFDNENETSTIAALTADKFIARHAAFCYTTPSHTPERPKARVVFLLDAPIMQAKNYALAAQSLLWLFGTADRQCKDAARFFYGSMNCDMEFLDNNVLPLDTVKHLIQQYQETGQRERQRQQRTWNTTPDQEEIASALKSIPPWGIDYDQWVSVLLALHHGMGDAALSLAETWADGGEGEVQRKWRSFNPAGHDATVGLGTIFHLAKQFGWRRNATANVL